MKKVFSVVLAIMICATLVFSAMAAEEFVPSITYKGHPEIAAVESSDGNDVKANLVIVPLSEADSLSKEDADLMKRLYKELSEETMVLPYEQVEGIDPEKMVIRELVMLTMEGEEEPENVSVTMELGVAPDAVVTAMVYADGVWTPALEVVNNGDGSVTFVFHKLGIVAISVEV